MFWTLTHCDRQKLAQIRKLNRRNMCFCSVSTWIQTFCNRLFCGYSPGKYACLYAHLCHSDKKQSSKENLPERSNDEGNVYRFLRVYPHAYFTLITSFLHRHKLRQLQIAKNQEILPSQYVILWQLVIKTMTWQIESNVTEHVFCKKNTLVHFWPESEFEFLPIFTLLLITSIVRFYQICNARTNLGNV